MEGGNGRNKVRRAVSQEEEKDVEIWADNKTLALMRTKQLPDGGAKLEKYGIKRRGKELEFKEDTLHRLMGDGGKISHSLSLSLSLSLSYFFHGCFGPVTPRLWSGFLL